MYKLIDHYLRLLFIFFSFSLSTHTAWADNSHLETHPGIISVGLYVSPPFVIDEGDHYSGMAIDLWQYIAAKFNIKYRYYRYSTITELLVATEKGEVNIAVTNLTITKDRAKSLTFTQPWYDAGLRIMIPSEQNNDFNDIFVELYKSGHIEVYIISVILILLATLFMTFFYRKLDKNFPKRWRDGLADSFYCVISILTRGKSTQKNIFGWLGTVWAALWMIFGIAIIAYITSSITSVMTTISLTRDINSLTDLMDKKVGVLSGSKSTQEYLARFGISVIEYNNIDEASDAMLKANKIDAIVADAPVLEYYVHHLLVGQANVIGSIFHPDKYGFALTENNALIKDFTLSLLELHEEEKIRVLKEKYFGFEP